MSMQVRKHVYRGTPGFLVCGTDGDGRPNQAIFVRTREVAERIREIKKRAHATPEAYDASWDEMCRLMQSEPDEPPTHVGRKESSP